MPMTTKVTTMLNRFTFILNDGGDYFRGKKQQRNYR